MAVYRWSVKSAVPGALLALLLCCAFLLAAGRPTPRRLLTTGAGRKDPPRVQPLAGSPRPGIVESRFNSIEIGAGSPLVAAIGFVGAALWMEQSRRRRARRLRHDLDHAMLASLSTAVALAGGDGVIRWKNDAWDRLAEQTDAELVAGVAEGTDYLQLCRHLDTVSRNFHEPLAEGLEAVLEGKRSEFTCEYYCGTAAQERWHEMLVAAVQGHAGGVLIFHRDVSERKRREIEARENAREDADTRRVTALGVMAASLAHELNQPLAAILANSQAAQRFLAVPAPNLTEVREILSAISDSDRHAVRILCRLRSLIQEEPLELQAVDLNTVIRDAMELVEEDARRRKVRILLELEPELPRVEGDRSQLQQVVLNLAMNGLEAMESGGNDRRLTIRSRREETGNVAVVVRDTGVGIPEEHLDQIFKAFHSTKSRGSGIGLWIARSFVAAHGGRIEAANHAEGGAIFRFTLPARMEEVT